MICDSCGKGDPVFHLTQIIDNQATTQHLCEACAREKGLDPSGGTQTSPLSDFLAQMGDDAVPAALKDVAPGNCGFCSLSFAGFRETGRLGCPHCYSSFEGHLRGLLRRIHGGTQHMGKVYLTPDPSAGEKQKRLEALRRKLSRAVDSEDFERAAEIRDQIRSLEPTR